MDIVSNSHNQLDLVLTEMLGVLLLSIPDKVNPLTLYSSGIRIQDQIYQGYLYPFFPSIHYQINNLVQHLDKSVLWEICAISVLAGKNHRTYFLGGTYPF
jgi:hypothetical protein